ncbi:MAG: hypothetical protein HY431_02565 [Candidatus Levybacteria bacterium]|nr:hypothetical protein [Candidatus Levybacteria bacterium]
MVATEAQAQRQPLTIDHRTRLARRLGLPQPDIAGRRKRIAELLNRKPLFPYRILKGPEGETVEPVKKFVQLLQNGNGGIVVANHRLSRDPFGLLEVLWATDDYFCDVKVITPVGDHQWKDILAPIANYLGVTAVRTVTPHTREQGGSFDQPPLLERAKTIFTYHVASRIGKADMGREEYEKKMRGKRRDGRTMLLHYLDTATDILQSEGEKPGINVLLPQAGREPGMTRFEMGPIQILIKAARKKGIKNIAFLVAGIGEKGSQNNRKGGFRPARTAEYTFAQPFTLEEAEPNIHKRNEELKNDGKEPNFTIGDLVYEIMLGVVPKGYKPKT